MDIYREVSIAFDLTTWEGGVECRAPPKFELHEQDRR